MEVFWIPELVVISLLSEWIIEEEKSTYFYPYLSELDYLELFACFDIVKLNLDADKREVIMQMYKISSVLIENLKNTKYKINPRRKKVRRKR